MGMDFTAYFGHSMDENAIHRLCHALNAERLNEVQKFLNYLYPFNEGDKERLWEVIPDWIGGTIQLSGPCGLDLTFSEHVCYVHHYIRWKQFLLNEEIQLYLRTMIKEFCHYVSADYAIYVPDNGADESAILDFIWDDENRDVGFIRNWLLERFGEPKERISEIYRSDDYGWESEGYYIDEFQDFN